MKAIILTDQYSLKRLCGLTLIERAVLTAYEEGSRYFVIITDGEEEKFRKILEKKRYLHLTLDWMSLVQWQKIEEKKERDGSLIVRASGIVHKGQWEPINSKTTLKKAEKIVLSCCRKPTDGLVSRYLNRNISLQMSRVITRLPVTAHHMTGFTLLVGLMGAYYAATMNFFIAFLIFQITSILDGCDGEIARLKFQKTKKGAWFDTISDNIIYVTFIFCFGWGMAQFYSNPFYLHATLLILTFIFLAVAIMYFYLKKRNLEGTLVIVERHLNSKSGLFNFFPRYFSFTVKRDFFAFVFFILAAAKQWQTIFWLLCLGSSFVFLYSLTLLPSSFLLKKYGTS